MNQDWQTWVALGFVAWAVIYVLRTLFGKSNGGGSCGACSGCSDTPATEPEKRQLHQLK